jgi:hypothetical protein
MSAAAGSVEVRSRDKLKLVLPAALDVIANRERTPEEREPREMEAE